MPYFTPTIALGLVRQHYRQLGLELPEAFNADLAHIEAALAERDKLRHDDATLVSATADALAAGKVPGSDKAVLAQLAHRQLADIGVEALLDQHADRRRGVAMRQHADEIIASLAPVVAAADAAIQQAREQVPDLNLREPAAAVGLAPATLALWGRAYEGVERVGRVVQVWSVLADAGQIVPVDAVTRPLVTADLSATQLSELSDIGDRDTEAAAAGHRLELASVAEFRRRVRVVQTERAAAVTQAEEAREQLLTTGRRDDAAVAAS